MTKLFCIVVTIFLLMMATGDANSAVAQSSAASPAPADPEANSAKKSVSAVAGNSAGEAQKLTSEVVLSVEADTRFGILTYVPEKWGELYLRLENSGSESRDLLCTSYVGSQSSLQFGRQVWLPGNSRLTVPHPLLFPSADQLKGEVANVHSLLIDRSTGSEALLKNESGQLLHDRSLLMTPTLRNSGVIAGWDTSDSVPQDVLDLMVAGRVNQGLNNSVTVLAGQFLPADKASLNYLDHIVIAEDRLLEDFAGLSALRQWLHAGGRLWVMLDRTDPELLERLLGDDFDGHVVDRVSLTSVRIDKPGSLLSPDVEAGEVVEYESPVEMARVVVSGMSVWNTVDGWPVAMTGSCGEGRILITTLGARGWIKSAPPGKTSASTDRLKDTTTAFIPLSPMEDLAAFVFSKREPEPLPQAELAALTQEFISYKVPSWTLIIGLMCLFLTLLSAIGFWLWRREQLEHFGWVGSIVAGLFGVAFTAVGLSYRYGVPETMAAVQFAQAISGTDDVRAQGTIAVFRQEGSTSVVAATRGGELLPDTADSDGATRRMVTTDLGKFQWEGMAQPAGLRLYPESATTALPNRIEAHAALGAGGIAGTLNAPAADTSDAILATRQGRLSVSLSEDGQFSAAPDQVLQPDQFLDVRFLGDVQDRRRRILQQLFANKTWKDSLVSPQLLIWMKNWDSGFQFGEGLQHQGETLMAVPLELTRPVVGTEIVIPSPLISYSGCRAPDGSLPTGFWDDLQSEWQERSTASSTWLSFQLPRSVLPLNATKARIDVKVSGAMGEFEILGVKEAVETSLQSVRNPVGSMQFEIDDPTVLQVDANGRMVLGVKAGVTPDPSQQAAGDPMANLAKNYWRIESLTLQLWGVTTELSAEE